MKLLGCGCDLVVQAVCMEFGFLESWEEDREWNLVWGNNNCERWKLRNEGGKLSFSRPYG